MLIAFIVLTIFSIIFGFIRIVHFFQRNPRSALKEKEGMKMHMVMSVYYIIDTWSGFMYAILIVSTMYITWTFKG